MRLGVALDIVTVPVVMAPVLPPSGATAVFSFGGSVNGDGGTPVSTFSRSTNAWNPETGAIAPHNLFLNSATGATQNITASATPTAGQILAGTAHSLTMKGTGSITIGGTGSGTLTGTGASDVVTLAFTPTAGTVSFTVTGSCTEVQVQRGTFATYVPTTSAAVYSPRYVTGKSGQGILIEEASTNNCTGDFSTGWTKVGTTITQSGDIDPFGNATAYRQVATSTVGVRSIWSRTATATAETWSIYAKKGTSATTANVFTIYQASLSKAFTINYDTGVITDAGGTQSSSNVTATQVGTTGWWRIIIPMTGLTIGQIYNFYPGFPNVSATLGDYNLVCFPQQEALPYATSLIPTTSASVTRGAETLTFNPTGILTAASGTISAWVYAKDGWLNTTGSGSIFDSPRGANDANRLVVYKTSNTIVAATFNGASAYSIATYTGYLTAGWNLVCLTWGDGNNPRLWINGAVAATAPSNNVPSSVLNTMWIGANYGGMGQPDTTIDQFRIYGRGLTAAEIAQLYRSGK